jgi:hypothetical protein
VFANTIKALIFFEEEFEPGNKVLILFAVFGLKYRYVI